MLEQGVERGEQGGSRSALIARVTAADLDADIEVPLDAPPATSDPNFNVDDGLEMGDEPNIHAPTINGS
jgi:hypothetical protein